jgi:ferredoxin
MVLNGTAKRESRLRAPGRSRSKTGQRVLLSMMATTQELEIAIDRAACRGIGECVLRAGRTFALDDEDCAQLVASDAGSNLDQDAEQVILAAARACPNFAISVTQRGVRLV